MVPACSIKVSRVSMYSGSRHVSSPFAYGAFTLSGRLSQNLSARITESIMRSEPRNARIPVWPLSISLAATLEIDVSFSSSGYLDVSVHRVPFRTLWIGVRMTGVLPAGFPHSDICGSKIICISPQLFAAYHVFLRLLVPRHPPCALFCLIICNIFACECITYAHSSRQRTFMHVLLAIICSRAHPVSEMLSANFHCSSLAIALAISLKNFTVVIKILKRIS